MKPAHITEGAAEASQKERSGIEDRAKISDAEVLHQVKIILLYIMQQGSELVPGFQRHLAANAAGEHP